MSKKPIELNKKNLTGMLRGMRARLERKFNWISEKKDPTKFAWIDAKLHLIDEIAERFGLDLGESKNKVRKGKPLD